MNITDPKQTNNTDQTKQAKPSHNNSIRAITIARHLLGAVTHSALKKLTHLAFIALIWGQTPQLLSLKLLF